jgi:hypothetical protein
MIDGALRDTRDHLDTPTKASGQTTCPRTTRPSITSSGCIASNSSSSISTRSKSNAGGPEARPLRKRGNLDRLEEQNRHLRAVTTDVLALAQELRKGTHRPHHGHERSRSRAASPPRNPAATRGVARRYRPRTRVVPPYTRSAGPVSNCGTDLRDTRSRVAVEALNRPANEGRC